MQACVIFLTAIIKMCSIFYTFCSRPSNNMINKIHERALRLILIDHISDFNTLLQNNNDICNHHRNNQTLLTEIYKIKNNLNPPIMNFTFERRNSTYNLKNFQEIITKRKITIKMGLQTLNCRSPQFNSLIQFKESVRKWDFIDYTCQTSGFCSIYLFVMHTISTLSWHDKPHVFFHQYWHFCYDKVHSHLAKSLTNSAGVASLLAKQLMVVLTNRTRHFTFSGDFVN